MQNQEIDFNITLKTFATKEKESVDIQGSTPELIAGFLVNPSFPIDTPTRKFLLAQKIAYEGKLMLNKADFDLVMQAIEHHKNTHDHRIIGGLLVCLGAIKWED